MNAGFLESRSGQPIAPDMSKTRLALFGAGVIGRTHIDRIGRSDNLELVGIADPTEAGRAIAQQHGIPWFADHLGLLDVQRHLHHRVLAPRGVAVDDHLHGCTTPGG